MSRPPEPGSESAAGALELAFAALDPVERLVLWRRVVEQVPPATVADELGRSVDDVLEIEGRALRLLRQGYDEPRT